MGACATWCAVASAAWGKTIVWRGIRYSMDSPTSTRVLHHAGQLPQAGPALPQAEPATLLEPLCQFEPVALLGPVTPAEPMAPFAPVSPFNAVANSSVRRAA
jgi:hypothetical protein